MFKPKKTYFDNQQYQKKKNGEALLSSKGAGFIVFEGLDGSGQTTQARLLEEYLKDKGCEVVLTKEPTPDSEAGREIKDILNHKKIISPDKLQELFAQDRKEHLNNLIIPALKENKTVISDRYFFSTFAYGAIDLDLEWLIKLNGNFINPDLTFILKVSPEICIERIKNRGEGITLFEQKEKLEKVWRTYEILSQRFENVYIIDGEKSIEEIHQEITKKLKS